MSSSVATERDEKFQIPKIIGGRLDMSNMGLTMLNMIPVNPKLTCLILNNNQIRSFKSLKPQPNLETIIARNNKILFLTGLSKNSKLKNLDITGSPIEKEDKFLERTLYTIGPQLIRVNGIELNDQHQYFAKLYTEKNQEHRMFLPKDPNDDDPDEEELLSPERHESFNANKRLYIKETAHTFSPFAYNEAVVYDLKRFGVMPIVTKSSTDDEIIHSIITMKKRNALLADFIESLSPNSDDE
jgi:hypothetical protein